MTCELPPVQARYGRPEALSLSVLPLQLPGDAVHGHRPGQADEDGEVNGRQGAVPRLSDAERTQGERTQAGGNHDPTSSSARNASGGVKDRFFFMKLLLKS